MGLEQNVILNFLKIYLLQLNGGLNGKLYQMYPE